MTRWTAADCKIQTRERRKTKKQKRKGKEQLFNLTISFWHSHLSRILRDFADFGAYVTLPFAFYIYTILLLFSSRSKRIAAVHHSTRRTCWPPSLSALLGVGACGRSRSRASARERAPPVYGRTAQFMREWLRDDDGRQCRQEPDRFLKVDVIIIVVVVDSRFVLMVRIPFFFKTIDLFYKHFFFGSRSPFCQVVEWSPIFNGRRRRIDRQMVNYSKVAERWKQDENE